MVLGIQLLCLILMKRLERNSLHPETLFFLKIHLKIMWCTFWKMVSFSTLQQLFKNLFKNHLSYFTYETTTWHT